MDELMSAAAAEPRFRTIVLSTFGGFGLLLALVGVYGVMSYAVSARRHELAVRAALGAGRADLARLVLGEAGLVVAIGVGLGVAAALPLMRITASLLFGIAPADPATFATSALLLSGAALAAAWVPALRAARADPTTALRDDA
jgi:ABC-type antimicrobial peptide transport system permease subunit